MENFVHRFSVPREQLDPIGNWHSPYFFLAFFEARIAFFHALGISEKRMHEENIAVIIASLDCNYFNPLQHGDSALIEIEVVKLGRSSMSFSFKVFKESDSSKKVCAQGKTTQVLLNKETKKPMELPTWIRAKLDSLPNP